MWISKYPFLLVVRTACFSTQLESLLIFTTFSRQARERENEWECWRTSSDEECGTFSSSERNNREIFMTWERKMWKTSDDDGEWRRRILCLPSHFMTLALLLFSSFFMSTFSLVFALQDEKVRTHWNEQELQIFSCSRSRALGMNNYSFSPVSPHTSVVHT